MNRPVRTLSAPAAESPDDSAVTLDAPELWRVELQVAEAVGQLMEFWGFKRQMGRLWTVLFLSPDPLDVAALAERLQMSTSAVSLSLAELSWAVELGCVHLERAASRDESEEDDPPGALAALWHPHV